MDRYVCIHGHFYQPPRENPWLEAIELQDSAYPHHDWNERITGECYAPNANARILGRSGLIEDIVNNYAKISFNFGATLLDWMEQATPAVYAAVLKADRESRKRFSGHGSGIAQCYNHMIMPLANSRDKVTQVRWGIEDFKHRFGRRPEGMWLAETAVDLETLSILAEAGIKYTILSPYQAGRVRKKGGRKWHDATGANIDPTAPYEQQLPSGKSIALFFYDGPMSQAIAFEKLLDRGEALAGRLLGGFTDDRNWPQLVHIATDGETYGHHHRHGEMALAYAVRQIENTSGVRLTNYGEYLAIHRKYMQRVEIVENTAWSCAHGIERWKADCGCCTGGRPEWNQSWRGPLRDALDWLRDALAEPFVKAATPLLTNPWAARDDYIHVILDRSKESVEKFMERNAARKKLSPEQQTRVLKLMELQRHAMLMYTSCGWFFDELSGIETVQVIQYAGRAVQLAHDLFAGDFEEPFLNLLEKARSNLAEHGTGRDIYEKWVKPARVDLAKVAAHYAVSSLFENYRERTSVYCYDVDRLEYRRMQAGRSKLAVGRCQVTSRVTGESERLKFACLHLGDHNLVGGVQPDAGDEAYAEMSSELIAQFRSADLVETLRRFDRRFAGSQHSLKTLFRDEQRKILSIILDSTLKEAESEYRQLFEQHGPLMKFLGELGTPIPAAFRTAAEVILNADLRRELSTDNIDAARLRALIDQTATWQAEVDKAGLSYTLDSIIERQVSSVAESPTDGPRLDRLERLLDVARMMPVDLNLSLAQNRYYALVHDLRGRGDAGDNGKPNWLERLETVGRKLSIEPKV